MFGKSFDDSFERNWLLHGNTFPRQTLAQEHAIELAYYVWGVVLRRRITLAGAAYPNKRIGVYMPQNEEESNSKRRIFNDHPLDVYSVRLTPWHARMARTIGNGSLTEGIRTSIEIVSKMLKDRKVPQ